jgi:hypothetical protein
MSKEFMKVYHMPFKAQEIKNDNFTNFRLQFDQAFEEMTKSFSEQQDEIIANYLYEKYKDTKVSDVWVLSKPDFEKFLLEMLPKWKGKNTDIIDNYMAFKNDNANPTEALKCLERVEAITKAYSIDLVSEFALDLESIKQALIKAEKEHKALEIIKEKNVDDYIKLPTKDKQEFINKLGKLEDIMEKYEIESLEELEELIKDYDDMAKSIVEMGLGIKVEIKDKSE